MECQFTGRVRPGHLKVRSPLNDLRMFCVFLFTFVFGLKIQLNSPTKISSTL